jgi:N-methylhydantoinase A/oxoprolinase/acetone carboxylase beta subunit
VRLRAGVPSHPDEPAWQATAPPGDLPPRRVCWSTEPVETRVVPWSSLVAGAHLDGPCLVESDETTVAVPPWAAAEVGTYGELVIRRAHQVAAA